MQGTARVFLDTQNDFGLRNVDAQNLHRIADFFNGVVVERVGDGDFATDDSDFHDLPSFPLCTRALIPHSSDFAAMAAPHAGAQTSRIPSE